jgi:hypothetical protein
MKFRLRKTLSAKRKRQKKDGFEGFVKRIDERRREGSVVIRPQTANISDN